MNREPLAVIGYVYEPRRVAHLVRTLDRFLGDRRDAQVVLVCSPRVGTADVRGALPGAGLSALAYDGRGWEFGAYQAGLDRLRSQGWRGAVTVFNDTAGLHYPLRRGELAALRRAAEHGGAGAGATELVGHVEAAGGDFAYRGQALSGWVRSNAFGLSPAALAALQHTLFSAPDFAVPSIGAQGLVLPDFLSPALRSHIQGWLMTLGRHGWRHHTGRAEVAPEVLRDKAGAIVLEMRMAATVLAAGGTLRGYGDGIHGAWRYLTERAFYLTRRLERRSGASDAGSRSASKRA